MKKLILHMPHSSTVIPSKDGFVLENKVLRQELLKLTDWYTDDLFSSEMDFIVKATFSRLFCDVERFVNDKDEVMAQYGMGVLYETTDSGLPMRMVGKELREHVISNYYLPHHAKLLKAVKSQLEEESTALIIDCHSFTNTPFQRDLDKSPNRPDICIGTDIFHTPKNLVDFTLDYFHTQGMSVLKDSPYRGTIVPLEYYQKDDRVKSIMIEINRDRYLDKDGKSKSLEYNKTKEIIQDYLAEIKKQLN